MDTGGAILQISIALIATLGLVLLLAFVTKKFTGIGGRNNSLVKIVSVTQLGTREKLVLVQAGEQQLLLGVTQQQISKLHDFDQPISEVSEAGDAQVDFSSTLTKWMRR